MEYLEKALETVRRASAYSEQWQGDGHHDEEVVYGNGIFTVGSNGDCEDFGREADAAVALALEWQRQDEREA